MVRLLFLGEHEVIRRDPARLLDGLRAKYPRLKEHELQEVARTVLEQRPARFDGAIKHLLGADILTADVTTIPAWRWMSRTEQQRLTRETVDQRRARIWPEGLSHTYVWRKSTGWTQDVTDADVEVIRRSAARHWFARADKDWRPVRTFDFPVIEAIPFRDAAEAKRYEASLKRTPLWTVK